jgi:hypothetical protein
MQQITSNPFLLEVARTSDGNNVRRRLELSQFPKRQRLIAAFRALRQVGFAESLSDGSEIRWYPTDKAIRSMELEEFQAWLGRPRSGLEAAFLPPSRASAPERAPDKQLVQEYRDGISKRRLVQWWRSIGTIVGGMAAGQIRMMGSEINGGFVFEPLGLIRWE